LGHCGRRAEHDRRRRERGTEGAHAAAPPPRPWAAALVRLAPAAHHRDDSLSAGLPDATDAGTSYHAPIPEVVITVLCLQPEAEQILDELERSPTFGSAGTENIDGRRGRRMHVSNVETVETACTALVDELRDLTWLWREYVRFDRGE